MPPSNIVDIYKSQGWNDPAAIQADINAGGWKSKVRSDNPAPMSSGGNGGGFGGDAVATARQMIALQQEAVKPAVQALEAQKQPLQARYDAIIQSLKGREQTETTAQQTALSQEYGKRGIPLASGAFQQDLLGKTKQISQNYGALEQQTGLEGQNALLDLASRIAQLQSGASQAGIGQGIQQYQFGQQQAQQAQQFQAQQAQAQAAQDLARRIYEQTTLPESLANTAYKNAETSKLSNLKKQLNGTWE